MFELKRRELNTHKGDYGKILIVAGKAGMVGASILCAKGAFRAGAGLVKVSLDENLFSIVQTSIPEAICINRNEIFKDINGYDAIVFGPGIGTDDEESSLLSKILFEYQNKIIIDADGLNIISKNKKNSLLKSSKAQIIITPHQGEAKRMLETDGIKKSNISRKQTAIKLFDLTGAVTVLKGSGTIVYDGNEIWVNSTGNPGMATAGSGDVLAGIIGALLGQGYTVSEAARLGVYIHGKAGDLARDEFGEVGLMAGDICNYTATAIKSMYKEWEKI